MLRQRFSVSTHPHYPVLLCSDGYSFTILQLVTYVPLSQLLMGLVLDSRNKLSLSPSDSKHPISDETSVPRRSSLDHGDVHDFAATFKDAEVTDMESTLGGSTTLGSFGVGGPSLFASLDAGAVRFAGMDSDLEQTQSSIATSTNLKNQLVELASFQLRAALGLLLSCGRLEPGNGVYPLAHLLQQSDVQEVQSEVHCASRLLLSTFLTLIESSTFTPSTEAGSEDTNKQLDGLFHELFGDILSLVPLDSFSQSHLEFMSALINGVLLTALNSSMRKHKAFTSLSQSEHTIQVLKEFADSVCEDVSIASELLESAVSVLHATYGMQPLSGADSAFHTPLSFSKKKKRQHKSDIASHLSVSLTTMLEVLGAIWQDIQVCSDTANKTISRINSSSPQHNRLQLRELGVLCRGLASSLQTAMTTLKSSHTQIRQLIHRGKAIRTHSQPGTSQIAHVKGHKGQDGNPITSSPDVSLSLLLSKLEHYDLKGALEIIHANGILTHSFSMTDTQLNMSTSVATLANASLAQFFSSMSPSARPVVACLVRLMMAFFSDRKLLIPLSTFTATTNPTFQGSISAQEANCTRFIELKRSEVVQAVRDQDLSKTWTVDCALKLGLHAGLWEEACEFVKELHEWKKAILLSLAYVNHSKLLRNKASDKIVDCRVESLLNFTHKLALNSIVSLLGLKVSGNEITSTGGSRGPSSMGSPQHCTEEMFHSITGTLQVCAAGRLDSVLAKLVTSLTRAVTISCQQLPLTVHPSVYLPAPPLYCPQPSIPEEVCLIL